MAPAAFACGYGGGSSGVGRDPPATCTTTSSSHQRRSSGTISRGNRSRPMQQQQSRPLLLLMLAPIPLLLLLLPNPAGAWVAVAPPSTPHHHPSHSRSSPSRRPQPLLQAAASDATPTTTMMDAIIEPRRIEEMEGFRVVERLEGVAFVRADPNAIAPEAGGRVEGGADPTPTTIAVAAAADPAGMGGGDAATSSSGGGVGDGGKRGRVLFLPGLDGSGCTLGPQVRWRCVCAVDGVLVRGGGLMFIYGGNDPTLLSKHIIYHLQQPLPQNNKKKIGGRPAPGLRPLVPLRARGRPLPLPPARCVFNYLCHAAEWQPDGFCIRMTPPQNTPQKQTNKKNSPRRGDPPGEASRRGRRRQCAPATDGVGRGVVWRPIGPGGAALAGCVRA